MRLHGILEFKRTFLKTRKIAVLNHMSTAQNVLRGICVRDTGILPAYALKRIYLTATHASDKIIFAMKKKFRFRPSIWQFLALGYLTAILIGSVLLVLPFSAKDGSTNYINSLFTSTSAVCVTGLSPFVTVDHWTVFGQVVLVILIQLGGLGFMTFVTSVFLLFRHSIGLYERKALFASVGGTNKLSGLPRLIKRIFIGTAIFELLGACLLCIRFVPDYGGYGVYLSIWHSISAFCNAGFDLIGPESLAKYATDPAVTLTICALIIAGGMGFLVWGDLLECKFNPKKFQLNTKVVLLMTAILLVLSTGLYMVFEWNNTLQGHNFGEKLLMCVFNATTPRTAGFYTTYPGEFTGSSFSLTLILMFIGGSSGSTAGGIKVGTFAVIIMGMINVFRGRRDINIGKKRIEYSLVEQALAIFVAFLIFVMLAVIAICTIENGNPAVTSLADADGKTLFERALFECFSALGTVGLSLNFTPVLGVASKIILIVLMYAGRVGILTLALALGEKHTTAEIRKPVDTLLIG